MSPITSLTPGVVLGWIAVLFFGFVLFIVVTGYVSGIRKRKNAQKLIEEQMRASKERFDASMEAAETRLKESLRVAEVEFIKTMSLFRQKANEMKSTPPTDPRPDA